MQRIILLLAFALIAPTLGTANSDGAADNHPESVRAIPPAGIAISSTDRAELTDGVKNLGDDIEALKRAVASRRDMAALIPDVQIYYNAVRYALTYNEFYQPREVDTAREMLQLGMQRAAALRTGAPDWNSKSGLVVRGYTSRIDGSVQPIGLVIPPGYNPGSAHGYRLDCWFHGRDEQLTELRFLNDRARNLGEFTPANTIVLHLYGRYCNANKFAGEVDLFEALNRVKQLYPIDSNRVLVRGFSMGGASCWQFATHFAGMWAAAAPGAGFAETRRFLNDFQGEKVQPTWFEKKLWHWYDSVDYALNLFNCPTVAYSGELDSQKQAADIMAEGLKTVGITMEHVIGKGAHHFYTPEARVILNQRLGDIAEVGRAPTPMHLKFTTWFLRYSNMRWLTIEGMQHEWERATCDAEVVMPHSVILRTTNVTAITLTFRPGHCPLDVDRPALVIVDGQKLAAPPVSSDRSWTAHFRKTGLRWTSVVTLDSPSLQKQPRLQGPIDDAFMDSFLMVRPTGTPMDKSAAGWCTSEMNHAVTQWRAQFRGEAPVVDDTALTPAQIASSNLVLWGDPGSNSILAQLAPKLPIRWDGAGVHVGGKTFAGGQYAPILIFPNPLNPAHYVVLNSGFTFREYAYLNNARQVPKLPDWAVIDTTTPPDTLWPGRVADAGFFDEQWKLQSIH